MADRISKKKRSWNMSRVKSKNTKPEIRVRSLLHRMGFRFRLHRKELPGCPDIVLPKYRTLIFVNGCFWHQHEGCKGASLPTTNKEFWETKLTKNKARDAKNWNLLEKAGWNVLVLWQCELKDMETLKIKLKRIREAL